MLETSVMTLPVAAVLPDLLAALRAGSSAVLVAPPGAGKTTAVAPALLGEAWCRGEVLLLSPRRLAARAAAERMASLAGEPVGRTFGYATRLDTKRSAATRVLVVTEGIFRNRVQADPELAGVSAVLFDEVHERSPTAISASRWRSTRRLGCGATCGSSRCRRRSTASASPG
jgi:ATP-dependent helicase HrpB